MGLMVKWKRKRDTQIIKVGKNNTEEIIETTIRFIHIPNL